VENACSKGFLDGFFKEGIALSEAFLSSKKVTKSWFHTSFPFFSGLPDETFEKTLQWFGMAAMKGILYIFVEG